MRGALRPGRPTVSEEWVRTTVDVHTNAKCSRLFEKTGLRRHAAQVYFNVGELLRLSKGSNKGT